MTFKPVRIAFLALAMIVTFVRCGGDTPTAPGIVSIALDLSSATIRVGTTVQIKATVTVDGVTSAQPVVFTSDNPAVLSVTTGGLLKALALGTANLTATSGTTTKTALITVVPGLPFSIAKTAGDNQSAFAGTALTVLPSVTVKDSVGNLLANVSVTFAVASGGGTVTGGAATTNAAGVATVGSWTLGAAAGTNTLTATTSGVAAVTFTATGNTAPATTLAVNAGDGQTAAAGSTLATAPSVIVRNVLGQPVAGVPVTFAVASGGGSITGAAQTTNAAGIATVGSWTLGATAGANTLTASAASLPTATFTATGTVVVEPLIALSSTTLAFTGVAGGASPASQTISITNSGTGTLSGLTLGGITYGAGATGWLAATLNGTTAPASISLAATIGSLAAGTYTATFSVASAVATNSPRVVNVTLTVASVSTPTVVVTTQPVGTLSGAVFTTQPSIKLVDQNGATLTGYVGQVRAGVGSGTGVISGTTVMTVVAGVATFTDLKITGSGTFTLLFTADNALSGSSAPFTIAALPASQIAIATQPGGAVANFVLTTQPKIEFRDALNGLVINANGPVTVAFGAGTTGGGTLTGTTTVNAVNGVAQFTNLKISATGTYTLAFTGGGFPTVTSAPFSVTLAPPVALAITTQPSGAATGAVLTTQPVVELRDVGGNVVAGATNAVTASVVGAGGTLTGTTTVNAVNGVATFTDLKVTGAGTYSLAFTAAGLSTATSGPIVITPLPPSQLGLSTQPSGAPTGTIFPTQPVVQVRDVNGGTVAGASNSVTATLVGAGGTLSGTTTVLANNGVATFTDLKVSGIGTYTITFSSGALTPVTSAPITITALPATKLSIQTQPSGAVTGSVFGTQPVVQVQDVTSGVVAGATNAVTAQLNGVGGTLSGTTTVAAVNGVATFTDLKVTGSGSYTITFSSGVLTSATSSSITITPLPATQLTIGTAPAGAATGAALATQPVVQVRDAANGVVNGAVDAVTATLNGAGGTLTGTTTVNAVNGVATFTNLAVTGVGTYTLTFTSGALTPVTSGNITITALPATKLSIQTQPAGAVTGSALGTQPVVQVQDASSGVVAGAANPVTATLVGAGGTLSGTTTVNAVNGIATFTDLAITGSGTYTIAFSSGALTGATSGAITIAPLPADEAVHRNGAGWCANRGGPRAAAGRAHPERRKRRGDRCGRCRDRHVERCRRYALRHHNGECGQRSRELHEPRDHRHGLLHADVQLGSAHAGHLRQHRHHRAAGDEALDPDAAVRRRHR